MNQDQRYALVLRDSAYHLLKERYNNSGPGKVYFDVNITEPAARGERTPFSVHLAIHDGNGVPSNFQYFVTVKEKYTGKIICDREPSTFGARAWAKLNMFVDSSKTITVEIECPGSILLKAWYRRILRTAWSPLTWFYICANHTQGGKLINSGNIVSSARAVPPKQQKEIRMNDTENKIKQIVEKMNVLLQQEKEDLKQALVELKGGHVAQAFVIAATTVEGVAMTVEALSSEYGGLTQKEKRKAVVEFADEIIKAPGAFEMIDGIFIGIVYDFVHKRLESTNIDEKALEVAKKILGHLKEGAKITPEE